jgi:hypothetical protein
MLHGTLLNWISHLNCLTSAELTPVIVSIQLHPDPVIMSDSRMWVNAPQVK